MSSSSSTAAAPTATAPTETAPTAAPTTTPTITTPQRPIQNLVVVLAGPTAAGKSDVAAKLCNTLFKGMIVSADSVQAYRGVQIGANKPTPAERKETPHFLVDVADHYENYNAAEWKRDAVATIQSLSRSNLGGEVDDHNDNVHDDEENPRRATILKQVQTTRSVKGYTAEESLLPVVCGGTMMYIQWLVHGQPDAMRPSETAVTQAASIIDTYQATKDFQGALDHVGSLGKVYTDRIAKFCGEDWYRLRRTLEVALTVQEADPQHQDDLIAKLYTGQRQGGLSSMGYDVRCFFLCPDDRMKHTRIIDERCEQMIVRGLLKETADLTLAGSLPDMAARAIGYRQTLDYFQQEDETKDDEGAFQQFLNDFSTATRRYAKKQMAWFRKEKDFLFVPVGVDEAKSERVQAAASAIANYCQMPREEYEQQLASEDAESALCKKKNEEQGKSMKFYQFERHILKPDTSEFENALAEAVKCRQRIQAKRRRLDDS